MFTRSTGLILAALVVSGCELPELAALERSLELSVVEVIASPTGDSTTFTLRFHNRGENVARACLGPGRSVSYPGSGRSIWVDHPGCVSEFTIPPGEDLTWSETIEGRVSDGPVEVGVEVVNPRRCGGAGCTSTMFKSRRREIP